MSVLQIPWGLRYAFAIMLNVSLHDRTDDFDAVFLEIQMAPSMVDYLRQNAWLLSIFALMCLIVGSLFWLAGAAPVMGFMGLELVLLFIAYRFGFNLAKRRERVTLSGSAFRVQHRDHRGHEKDFVLQPYWLSVRVQEIPGRVSRLFAASRGEEVEIGAFLGPSEREQVATALQNAVSELRNQPVS